MGIEDRLPAIAAAREAEAEASASWQRMMSAFYARVDELGKEFISVAIRRGLKPRPMHWAKPKAVMGWQVCCRSTGDGDLDAVWISESGLWHAAYGHESSGSFHPRGELCRADGVFCSLQTYARRELGLPAPLDWKDLSYVEEVLARALL